MNTHIPLLAPKHISQFNPKEYREYLRGLWIDPATTKKAKAKGPIKYLTATTTKKGSLVIRCKRDPKEVTREEIEEMRISVGMTHLQAWNALHKRKIKVVSKLAKTLVKIG